MNKRLSSWIEATRPHTLPVSIAGVIAGCACAILYNSFNPLPAICCLLFATGAQIVSNFANEYFDYKNGLDRKGREGFRRGVTEGDISPKSMLTAIIIALILTAIPGLLLTIWGSWRLIPVGILIFIFALAYSAGPYPLSHHGLGDIAVIIFFGIIPVGFTAYLQFQSTQIIPLALIVGLGVGILAANVLIVNNYRDADDDAKVGKRTTVVIFGRKRMSHIYLINSLLGIILLCTPAIFRQLWMILPLLLSLKAYKNYIMIINENGAGLNLLLKQTAMLLLSSCLILLLEAIIGNLLP